MALSLRDIRFAYGAGTRLEQPALAGVSLEVERGELAVVLGPTGSGKSTLLLVAAGLIEPDDGSVTVDTTPISSALTVRSAGVGIVFQSPETQLFAESVLDDVAYGPGNQGLSDADSRARARESLVAVGLDPETFGPRSPFALSGGEARRVALAGVLAMQPRYLLLDEPTAGLDANGRADIQAAIAALRERSGIVIVTHDAEEFLGRADKALLLSEGEQMFSGSAAELVQRPAALAEAGLRPPPVLETLQRARAAGASIPHLTLDPMRAAVLMARAKQASR